MTNLEFVKRTFRNDEKTFLPCYRKQIKKTMFVLFLHVLIVIATVKSQESCSDDCVIRNDNLQCHVRSYINNNEEEYACGPIENWDVSRVTSFYEAFRNKDRIFGTNTFNANLSKWNVERVTTFRECFRDTPGFEGRGLENWNVESVSDFAYFATSGQRDSVFNPDLNRWNTNNVMTLEKAFEGAVSFNFESVRDWNTARVTNMASTFRYVVPSIYGVA